MFQVVSLTTADHQLRKGLDVVVQGIVGQKRFYTSVWCFRAAVFLLMGPLYRALLSKFVIKSLEHTVRMEIGGVAATTRPVRVSTLAELPLGVRETLTRVDPLDEGSQLPEGGGAREAW